MAYETVRMKLQLSFRHEVESVKIQPDSASDQESLRERDSTEIGN